MSHDPYPLPNDPNWQGPHPAEAMFVGSPEAPVVVVCLSREVALDDKARPVVRVQLIRDDRHDFVTCPLVGFGLLWKSRIEDFAYGTSA